MKTKITKVTATLMAILLSSIATFSQTIITNAPVMTVCPGTTTVSVPITVHNFSNVASVSLALNFDHNVLTWMGTVANPGLGYTANPGLTGFVVVNASLSPTPGVGWQIKAAWFSVGAPLALPDNDILFTFKFNYLGGSCGLIWDPEPGNNQYSDIDGTTLDATFIDGSLTGIPPLSFSSNPTDVNAPAGTNATFNAVAAGATTLQWQVSTDNGLTWTDLMEAPPYSGVNTTDLLITSAPLSLSGYMYHCVATQSDCNLTSTSGDAMLTVANACPYPTAFNVTGGGAACQGGPGVPVGLDQSDTAVNYQLYLGGNPVGVPVAGNLNPFSFGDFTDPGTYTVIGSNDCGNGTFMTGSAVITQILIPGTYYVTVTDGGTYCQGQPGVQAGLDNSDTGINYELFLNGISTGLVMPGTGSALDFGFITDPGNYTIYANNSCGSFPMGNTITVTMNQLPAANNMTGGGSFCNGGPGVSVGLDASEPGASYELLLNGAPTGNIVAGTGSSLDFGMQTMPGSYSVRATNTCGFTDTQGSVDVMVNDLPSLFNVTGGGQTCSGGSNVNVGLDGSETGISYELFIDGASWGTYPGSGTTIDFGSFATAGTFTVLATNDVTGCSIAMSGAATIIVSPAPMSFDVTNGGNICPGQTRDILLSGSENQVFYQLYLDGLMEGPMVMGTGSSLTMASEMNPGTYTVLATTVDGCQSWMNGSADLISIPVLNVTGNPADVTVTEGNPASFTVSANTATTYDWQVSTDFGGTYSSVINDLVYSGQGTSTLQLASTNMGMNNYMYQCVVGETLCNQSQTCLPAILTVQAMQDIITTAPTITTAVMGTNVIVPVTIENASNIASLSLTLNYDPTVLTYLNYQNENPALGGTFLVNPIPNQIKIGWYSIIPASISNDVLFELVFTYNGGYSALNWNTGTPGDCQYSDLMGTILPATFVDGSVTGLCPDPLAFNVTGGGSYCANNPNVSVGLDGSETGVTYSLYVDGLYMGFDLAGTGSALDFGIMTLGNYTVMASKACGSSAAMTGDATVILLPAPNVISVNGGGSYCPGGNGMPVGLYSSDIGTSYELFLDGVTTGMIIPGTGTDVTFGNQTAIGSYTVVGSNSCASVDMYGTVYIGILSVLNVTLNPADAAVTAGDAASFQAGSDFGTSFSWEVSTDGGNTFSPLPNSSPYSGVTTAELTINPVDMSMSGDLFRCTMTESTCNQSVSTTPATLTVNQIPTIITTAPSITNAIGGTTVIVPVTVENANNFAALSLTLNYDPTVLTYQTYQNVNPALNAGTFLFNQTPDAIKMGWFTPYVPAAVGTGTLFELVFTYNGGNSPLTWSTAPGDNQYANEFGISLPSTFVDGFVTGTLCTTPVVYTVGGGGSICTGGGNGAVISLSNSETDVTYELYLNGFPTGNTMVGTGSQIFFGGITTTGNYTMFGTKDCGTANMMSGTAVVDFYPALMVTLDPSDVTVTAGGSAAFSANSNFGTSYLWEVSMDGGLTFMPLTNTAPYTGATSNTLTIDPASYGMNSYIYHCIINENNCNTNVTTANATLTVNQVPVIITIAPSISNAIFGNTVIVPVTVENANGFAALSLTLDYDPAVLTYQSYQNVNPALSAGTFLFNQTATSVKMGWFTPFTPASVGTGTLFELVFTFNGGNSPLTWSTAPGDNQYADELGTTLDASFTDGFVTGTSCLAPVPYNVGGGGTICSGGAGVSINLDNSEADVNYELMLNGIGTANIIAGTGAPVSFGDITAPGTYTITGTRTCGTSAGMTGSATIDNYPALVVTLNPIDVTVTDGGSATFSAAGDIASTYSWEFSMDDGLTFSPVPNAAPYSGINTATLSVNPVGMGLNQVVFRCMMTESNCNTSVYTSGATLTVNPVIYIITTAPSISNAMGGTQVVVPVTVQNANSFAALSLTLNFDPTVLTYVTYQNINPALTGGTFLFNQLGNQVKMGWFTPDIPASIPNGTLFELVFTYASTGGYSPLTWSSLPGDNQYADDMGIPMPATFTDGFVTGTACTAPNPFVVSGGGMICSGGSGVSIDLSNSETDVNYQLMLNGTGTANFITGTGNPISFTGINTIGTYTIHGSKTCGTETDMTGSATIDLYPALVVTLNPVDASVTDGGSTSFSAAANNASSYTWEVSTDGGLTFNPVPNAAPYSGVNTAGLAINPVGMNLNQNLYRCMITESNCNTSVYTTDAMLTVNQIINIITTAPSISNAMGGNQVVVPISIQDANSFSALSLTLNFDPGVITYVTYQNVNPALSGGTILFNQVGNQVKTGWFTTATPASISNGTLFELVFTYASTGGYSPLTWSTSPGDNQYADDMGIPIPATFTDGFVTGTACPAPFAFNLSGGGAYCTGTNGVSINLDGSETNVTYELFMDGNGTGNYITGTGSPVSFTNITAAGNYTVSGVKDCGTEAMMNGSVDVSILPLPALFEVNGGGTLCAGSQGFSIGLSGSEMDATYELFNNGISTGVIVSGTGSNITFGSYDVAGVYTVIATNGCGSDDMNLSATITILPYPVPFNVSGGGSFCPGGNASVDLSGSETGVTYELILNGTGTGMFMSGTGSSLSWTALTDAGVYTVTATNTCGPMDMTGTATIIINPYPVAFNVTGGGSYCAVDNGVPVGLDGSETDAIYTLYYNGVMTSSTMNGTGNPISFGLQTAEGDYTIIGTNNCGQTPMNLTATIVINPLPAIFTVSGGGSFCIGGNASIELSLSETGTTYQLFLNGSSYSLPLTGTGNALTWPGLTLPGVYTIFATNNCGSLQMDGGATITVNPLPSPFEVSGGGSFCAGGNGMNILLSSSEIDATYDVLVNGVNLNLNISGTGNPMTFGPFTDAGVYTIVATNACGNTDMTGSATIIVNPYPVLYVVTGGGSYCTGLAGLAVGLSNSESGVLYTLVYNGVATALTQTGTGSSFNFSDQSLAGTYTIFGTNACGQTNMTGSVDITIDPLPAPFIVSGGGTFCAGGSASVTLSGSETGVTYKIFKNGIDMGQDMTGTGNALSWPGLTSAGSYTVSGTNLCGTLPMPGTATITVNPYPVPFSVTGGGSSCAGNGGVSVGLSNSETGTTYDVLLNGLSLGLSIPGTGSALSLGFFTQAGTYTVTGNNSCGTVPMNGFATITINPFPVPYNVTGGGSSCTGTAGFDIGLDGSENGVSYTLLLNGVVTGLPLTGTGNAISFGTQTVAGNYTATGTNACGTSPMNGSATISISPAPTQFAVTGGGSYIAGGPGLAVGLSSSQLGVNYELLLDGTSTGNIVAGTGSAITFGSQTAGGTYTVLATFQSSSCSAMMTGGALIIVTPVILTNPHDTAIASGFSAGFSVTALGATIFQWQESTDGGLTFHNIVNNPPYYFANTTDLQILGVPLSMNGNKYRIAVSNSNSPLVYSGVANLIVYQTPPLTTIAPYVTACPGTQVMLPVNLLNFNDIAAFNITLNYDPAVATIVGTANENPALSTGVQFENINYSIPGTFYMAWFSIVPASFGNGKLIDLVVNYNTGFSSLVWKILPAEDAQYANYVGSVMPSIWINGVLNSCTSLTITQQPANDTVCEGGTAHFTVAATGGTSYQWRVTTDFGATWTDLVNSAQYSGVNSPTLTVNNVNTTMTNYLYNCVVNPGMADATLSNVASPVVVPYYTLPATIVATPGNVICPGTSVTFSVSSTANLTGATYAWYVNSVLVGNGMTYTSSSLSDGDVIKADVIIQNNCSAAVVPTVTMIVNPFPVIVTPPADFTGVVGDNPTFSVTATSPSGAVSYQWQLSIDGGLTFNNLTNTAPYSNVNAATLNITSATLSMDGYLFRCIVTENMCGNTATTTSAILHIFQAPIITTIPDLTVCGGNQIVVPVLIDNFIDVSSASLKFNFDPSVLTFAGFQNVNPLLSAGLFNSFFCGPTPAGDQMSIFWFGFPSVTIPNGSTLVEIVFNTVPGSSTLAWDPTFGNTMYTNGSGITIPANFINGVVTVNALPIVYNVSGGGQYCVGSGGLPVLQDGSQVGVNYALFNNGVATGQVVAGTGAAISFGNQVPAGTYTVVATNASTGCVSNMSGNAVIVINPLPVVTWTNTLDIICESDSTYVLTGGMPAGGTYSGTAVTNGIFNAWVAGHGTYTLTYSYMDANGCVNSATNTITVKDGPTPYAITGGGSFCAGGAGVPIGLVNSEPSIVYQLMINGVNSGNPIFGTIGFLNFGLQTIPGVYQIIGLNIFTGCTAMMIGSVTVTVNPLPVAYNMTGGGSYCSGGSGLNVGLSGSQTGINYELYLNGFTTGQIISGTGSALNFGSMTTAGVYTVWATNAATSCTKLMNGTSVIIVNPLPVVGTVTGGGSYCSGGNGVPVGLNQSQIGIDYSLILNGTSTGIVMVGNGGPLSFGNQTAAGTYTVVATNPGSLCTSNMTGSAVVVVNPLPLTYNVTGGGSFCSGATGVPVGLSGSQTGVNYELILNGTTTGVILAGTGAALNFGNQLLGGTYTVLATDATSACVNNMTGNATIVVNPLPLFFSVTGGGGYCVGGTGVNVGLAGSIPNVSYALYLNGVATGNVVTGTGSALSFGLQTLAGTYTVVATSLVNGCVNNMSGSVTVTINALPVATAGNTSPLCAGSTLNLSAGGGTSYIWSGPNGFFANIQNPTIPNVTTAATGTYTVTVTNNNGCMAIATTTVTINPGPVVTTSSNSPVCEGQNLTLTASGGTGYSWSGPNSFTSILQNPVINAVSLSAAGTYTVVVTNANGCSTTQTINVGIKPLPFATAVSNSPVCTGSLLTLTATGGTSFAWSGPNGFTSLLASPSIASVTASASGTYTVTVTSAGGCSSTASVNVVVNPLPVASASSNTPQCAGATLNLSANGGIFYAWTGPNGFSSVLQNPAIAGVSVAAGGTYTVTVTDINGCSSTATTAVTINAAPVIITTSNSPVCEGQNLNLSASGGGTYSWTGPNGFTSTLQSPVIVAASPAATGTYTVVVTGGNGCSSTQTINAVVNPLPVATAGSNSPVCEGSLLTFTATGGTTYSWSGPNAFTSTLPDPAINGITAAAAGTYTVTVTSAFGCSVVKTVTVVVNSTPTAVAGNNSPICAGNTLNLTAGGGTSYLWSGPNSFGTSVQNPSINGATLANSGTYSVTVTNASGCSAVATTNVVVNPLPIATAISNSPVCVGETINFTATGGATYAWSGPNGFTSASATPSIANSTAAASGTYTVTVTTAAGCSATATVTVVVNALPTASASSNSPQCAGATLNLSANGGVTYQWTGPNGFSSVLQNPAITDVTTSATGTYTVTVTNSNGCSATATTNVTINAVPVLTTTSNSPICEGQSLTLVTSAGTTYSWTGPNGFTSTIQNPVIAAATPAASGTYTVVVTNALGCSTTQSISVVVNPLPIATAGSNSPVCEGSLLSLTASGGTTYAWSGPNGFTSTLSDPDITGVTTAASGTYTVTVTSAFGCSVVKTVTVVVNNVPAAIAGNNSPICAGSTLNLTASGGTSYIWTGPNSFGSIVQNPSIANATLANAGTYSVTVTNANGCSSVATTNVVVNPMPVPGAQSNSPICVGATLNLTATGGATYNWSGPNGFTSTSATPSIANATASASGTYSVTVTSAAGCFATATVTVVVNDLPLATATSNSPQCAGSTLNLTATGGVIYAWTGPNGFSSVLAAPSITNVTTAATGTYSVVVTNLNGCSSTATTSVTINPAPVLILTSNSPICEGQNLSLGTSAGTSYSWTGPNGFTSTVQNPVITAATPAATGTYTVVVSNGTGCSSTQTINVVVNPLPVATASSNSPVCMGSLLTLTATGGTTYAWSGPNGFTSTLPDPAITNVTLAAAGTYTVTVTSAFGCSVVRTVTVVVNNLPAAIAGSNSPICEGSTLNLTSSGGATFAWSGPNSFGSTLQNPSIAVTTLANAGTYTVTVTSASGCLAIVSTNVLINPMPVPAASSNSPICVGETLNLTATGGVTYSWSGPNGFTSNSATPSIANATALASGTYTVTVTSAAGCSAITTANVVVNALPVATASSNSPQCAGGTLNLSATGGTSYIWSGPNSFVSNVQNPTIANVTVAATGTYVVTVTNANGCSSTATTAVTINPLPVATASSNSPICSGQTLNLTSTGGGTYVWSGPNGFTSVIATPSIAGATVAASGVYTVTVSNGVGCNSTATVTVSVNPNPVATAGSNSPVCAGGTLLLTSGNGGNAATYAWSGPNGFSSTVQNPVISGVTAAGTGTYTVTVTNTFGCTSTASAAVTINANPVLTVGSNSPVCVGNTLNLTSSGGTAYSWTGPNAFASASQNPSIANAQMVNGGTYFVTVTNASGCQATGNTTVVINPLPIASATSNSPICAGQTLNLTAAGGSSFSWSGPGGFTNNTANPSIPNATAAASGTYTVTVSNAAGCSSTASVNVVVNALPAVTWTTALGTVCIDAAPFALSGGLPSGAPYTTVYTGPGVVNGTFYPAIAGAGTKILTYTVTNATTGCTNFATNTITVSALPTVDAGPNVHACFGTSVTLTAIATPPTVTYQWSVPPGNTASITVVANDTTTYLVTVTNAFGCKAVDSVVVMSLPLPIANAGPNQIICHGDSAFLHATGGNGPASYVWNDPLGQSGSNIGVHPLLTTTYTVTVTNVYGCTATDNTIVVVNPIPSVTLGPNQTICENMSTTLTPLPGGYTNYLWSTALENVPLVIDSTGLGLNNPTVFSVTVTLNGCQAAASVTVNFVPCPGVPTISEQENIIVYPNPTNGNFNVSIENVDKPLTMDIYDQIGRLIHSEKLQNSGVSKYVKEFDLNYQPTGIYFLRFTDGEKVRTRKLIVR